MEQFVDSSERGGYSKISFLQKNIVHCEHRNQLSFGAYLECKERAFVKTLN